ncbi:MAG TPA: hypothetical protein VG942_09375 [Hyphomonadaceae bacterium]|jgi:hypothetical protein|nr:hypothetical protein [Hyphomonadaceae bacterium]
MRAVPLLTILVACGLSASVAPDPTPAVGWPAAVVAAADSETIDAEYRALQQQADMALDTLRQSRERRLASATLAAN